ncbi:MAG: hypothetical protein V4597_16440 [Pseudomonadota bacterium]
MLTRSVISGGDPNPEGPEAPLLPVEYRFAAIQIFFDNFNFSQLLDNIRPSSCRILSNSHRNRASIDGSA